MTRQVLLACLPWTAVLGGSIALLWLLARLHRARFDWGRIRLLPGDELGTVQSLSFVLTLPAFVMVMLFILQVSQLMIATIAVHYAAYAGGGARSSGFLLGPARNLRIASAPSAPPQRMTTSSSRIRPKGTSADRNRAARHSASTPAVRSMRESAPRSCWPWRAFRPRAVSILPVRAESPPT